MDSHKMGMGDQIILQAEVDSTGRIWIVTSFAGVDQVTEIVLLDGQPTAVISYPEFTITETQIYSLDADNQGRLWASVWGYGHGRDESRNSLNILDGETWQELPDQGVDLRDVVRIRYDNQRNVWMATECGGVMTYDGATWTTVVEAAAGDECSFDEEIDGITLDDQGWVWT